MEDLADIQKWESCGIFSENIDGKQKFRVGGTILTVKGLPEYIVLVNTNSRIVWSVSCKNTTFFRSVKFS